MDFLNNKMDYVFRSTVGKKKRSAQSSTLGIDYRFLLTLPLFISILS